MVYFIHLAKTDLQDVTWKEKKTKKQNITKQNKSKSTAKKIKKNKEAIYALFTETKTHNVEYVCTNQDC